jgi:MSHA biogenesis protein MshO
MGKGAARGFTLIELITVVVVLAVVSVGIAGFIRTGTQIYADVTERDQLLSQSRFVVERLNRELRAALPNSLRVSGNSAVQCLEFVPIRWSTFYFDVPVAPESAGDEITVVATSTTTDNYSYTNGDQVVVYPVSSAAVYATNSGYRYPLASAPQADPSDAKKTILTLNSASLFATDSPSSRLYIVGQPVSYCATASRITRHQNYGFNALQTTAVGSGVLMAEQLVNNLSGTTQEQPFRVNEATLSRNASVVVLLNFELNEEIVVFNNEVHLPNVP